MPSSIREIESDAFNGCPLDTLILRGTCRIGNRCFRTNALTYVHIADSIQILMRNAFYQIDNIPFSSNPCKIYIRHEFHDHIQNIFKGSNIEFIENEFDENNYVLK